MHTYTCTAHTSQCFWKHFRAFICNSDWQASECLSMLLNIYNQQVLDGTTFQKHAIDYIHKSSFYRTYNVVPSRHRKINTGSAFANPRFDKQHKYISVIQINKLSIDIHRIGHLAGFVPSRLKIKIERTDCVIQFRQCTFADCCHFHTCSTMDNHSNKYGFELIYSVDLRHSSRLVFQHFEKKNSWQCGRNQINICP